jgi:ProP effector
MFDIIERPRRPRGILTLRDVVPRATATEHVGPDARTIGGRSATEPQPPTLSRKAARLAEAKALLRRLAAQWPALFATAETRPLAIGIHREIIALMPEVDPALLGAALRLHTRGAGYVEVILTAGHPRFDLQGEPTGAVTQEQVERLMAERARLAEKSARRRAEEQRMRRQRVA